MGRKGRKYRWKREAINTVSWFQHQLRRGPNIVSDVCLNRSESVYVFMARITGNSTSDDTDHTVLTSLQSEAPVYTSGDVRHRREYMHSTSLDTFKHTVYEHDFIVLVLRFATKSFGRNIN